MNYELFVKLPPVLTVKELNDQKILLIKKLIECDHMIESLEMDKSSLLRECAVSDKHYHDLIAEYQAKCNEVETLVSDVENLKRHNSELLDQNADLQHENSVLKKSVSDLKCKLLRDEHIYRMLMKVK